MPTNGVSIKPLKVKLVAGEEKAGSPLSHERGTWQGVPPRGKVEKWFSNLLKGAGKPGYNPLTRTIIMASELPFGYWGLVPMLVKQFTLSPTNMAPDPGKKWFCCPVVPLFQLFWVRVPIPLKSPNKKTRVPFFSPHGQRVASCGLLKGALLVSG